MNLRIIFPLLLSLFLFSGCSKDLPDSHDNMQYLVDKETIVRMLQNFKTPTYGHATGLRGGGKDTTSVKIFKDSTGLNALYVVNYTENAENYFVIFSADSRVIPVIAYGEGNFVAANGTKYPSGLAEWLGQTLENFTALRLSDSEAVKSISDQWTYFTTPPYVDPDGCAPSFDYTVGPLCSAKWSQGCTYNDYCPILSCSSGKLDATCSSTHAWTGCVATAMAQIMRYYSSPASHGSHTYAWSTMPNNSGNTNVARLMADIGFETSMDYGCDGSGTTMNKAKNAFKNEFGYSSQIDLDDWDGDNDVVKAEIHANRPVLVGGSKKCTWLGVPYECESHAWVCDGYHYYGDECYYRLYFHMNWGWGASGYIGYYAFGNFNVGGFTFNYHTEIIKNIHI